MILSELLKRAGIPFEKNFDFAEIKRIETNTESAMCSVDKENILFVCITGTGYDTHDDICRLSDAGVKYIIAEKETARICNEKGTAVMLYPNTRKAYALLMRAYYGFPDKRLFKIAITGTKGKTTVAYMLRSIFEQHGVKCGMIGTNGIIYNGNTYECANSTPGSEEYYYHLHKMAEEGVTHVVCEVTSQALKQYRTYGTVFDIAVFTNLFPDHIGGKEHVDFSEYKRCKGMLFSSCRKAVICSDNSHSEYYAGICRENSVPCVGFSVREHTDDLEDAISFENERISVPMPGEFNKANAMCAAYTAKFAGVNCKDIKKGIEKTRVYGRCERVDNPCGVEIVIDYAHNKESLENILKALKKCCKGTLFCVFGAGGDRTPLRRSGMGKAASEYADYTIITNDNPRSEDPNSIIADIIEGIKDCNVAYEVICDRRKAIYKVLSMAKKGDVVLLAGKGAQTFEEINGVKYHLDEREIVRDYYNGITQQ